MRRPWPALGRSATEKKNLRTNIYINTYIHVRTYDMCVRARTWLAFRISRPQIVGKQETNAQVQVVDFTRRYSGGDWLLLKGGISECIMKVQTAFTLLQIRLGTSNFFFGPELSGSETDCPFEGN